MYWVTCPHCQQIIERGYKSRAYKIGSPITFCPKCQKLIVDNDKMEWGVMSPVSRFLFSQFANAAFGWHFFGALAMGIFQDFGTNATLIMIAIAEAIIVSARHFLFKALYEDEIKASIKRSENPDYIEILNIVEYRHMAKRFRHKK